MTVGGGHDERSPTVFVHRLGIRALLQENAHDILLVSLDSPYERSAAEFVHCFSVCTLLQEKAYDRLVVVGDS